MHWATIRSCNGCSPVRHHVLSNGKLASFGIREISAWFYPRLTSGPTGIVVSHCVRPSVCPSVRLSVCPSRTTFPLYARYNEADRYINCPCSANFWRVPRKFEITREGFLTRSERRRYCSHSLRISGISLKFDGVMHSNMKQIAI